MCFLLDQVFMDFFAALNAGILWQTVFRLRQTNRIFTCHLNIPENFLKQPCNSKKLTFSNHLKPLLSQVNLHLIRL